MFIPDLKKSVLSSVAIATVFGFANAGDLNGKFIITPYLGYHVFDGERKIKSNAEIGIGVEKFINRTVSLGADLGYIPTEKRNTGQDRDIFSFSIYATKNFYKKHWVEKFNLPLENVATYITAGIGGAKIAGFHLGTGIRFIKNEKIGLKMEAKLNQLWSGKYDIIALMGLNLMFGGKEKPIHKVVKHPSPRPSTEIKDFDGDGVPNDFDKCPNTPKGVKVDSKGCALDSDHDGVVDYMDLCPFTLQGIKVDKKGCAIDSDNDTIPDYIDKCPNTPAGEAVNDEGCPITEVQGKEVPVVVVIDTDKDGVEDKLDKCPDTPKGLRVDVSGCPLDSDYDGVPDFRDKCPNTPEGYSVNEYGCFVAAQLKVLFDSDSAVVKPQYLPEIQKFAEFLKKNPKIKIEIQGHTDSSGSAEYNMKLSQRRAEAIRKILIERFGISPDRVIAKGYGETRPIAPNNTPEGKAKNRRVIAIIILGNQ